MYALPTKGPQSDEWLGCGASVISPTFALTSAHCFGGGLQPCSGPKQLAVWVGQLQLVNQAGLHVVRPANGGGGIPFLPLPRASPDSFRVKADLICHPKFDGKCSHGNDIALLKFREPLPNWVKPVALNLGSSGDGEGELVTAMGHGLIEDKHDPQTISWDHPEELRQVSVSVLAKGTDACKRVFAGGYGCSDEHSEAPATHLEQQLCAAATDQPERDTCAGDSGSPMVDAAGTQVAVVSYGGGPGGRMRGPGRICADPQYPGIYAKVSAFRDWIVQHVLDLPTR